MQISKLRSFTRKKNHLHQLLDGGAQDSKLKEVYGEIKAAFDVLEKAHEEFFLSFQNIN